MNIKKLLITITFLCFSVAVIGCAVDKQIQTLRTGVLTVAVTLGAPTNQYDSQLWIRQYVEQFATAYELTIFWVVVPFNESWLLASRGEVDLVATNVANFPDRAHSGATFSAPFLYERRALRINPEDREFYEHISDFIGKTVGVVSGMAAERDINRRASSSKQQTRLLSFTQSSTSGSSMPSLKPNIMRSMVRLFRRTAMK